MLGTARTTAALAAVSGLCALGLLLVALMTGGAQELFEVNRPAADYARLLVANGGALRLCFGIDYVFIVLYAALFLSLAVTLRSWHGSGLLPGPVEPAVTVATAALLLTALLDLFEDAHILAMLAMAEQGQPIPQSEIAWQMAESQIKFAVSYFALFVLSFALPRETALEKALVVALRWLQLPLGAAIFVVGPPWSDVLGLSRAIFFVVALWALAIIVARRGQ